MRGWGYDRLVQGHRSAKRVGVFVLIFAFVFTFSFRYEPNSPSYPFRYFSYAILALAIWMGLLVAMCRTKRIVVSWNSAIILSLLVLFFGSVLLSTIINIPAMPDTDVIGLINQVIIMAAAIICIGTGVIASGITSTRYFLVARMAIIHLSVISAFIALQAYLTGTGLFSVFEIVHLRWDRLYGWYGNPTILGALLAAALILLIPADHKSRSVVAFSTFILLLGSLVMTGSRGPLVGMVIGMAFYALLQVWLLREWRIVWGALVVAIGGGAVLVSIFFAGSPFGIFLREQLRLSNLVSGSGRFDIWRAAIDTVKGYDVSHMLFGGGHQSFINSGSATHSEYFRLLVDFGLVPLIIAGALCLTVISVLINQTVTKKSKAALGMAALFVSLMAQQITNDGLFSPSVYFLLFVVVIGFILSTENDSRRIGEVVR